MEMQGGSIAVADDATLTTIDGIATFTTGGVNLRQ